MDLSPAAWLGALEQALPDFSGEKGVCPPLAELSGSEEDDLHRWRPLLESGLRTGEELRRAWYTLKQRGSEMATYLGEELEGALAQTVEGAGEGSRDGNTRMAVVEQLEGLTLACLEKNISEWRDRSARPVGLVQQRDKMTTTWLLSHPTPHYSLSSPIFQEGLAMALALPSPACRDRLGEVLGDRRVDLWGDEVRCVTLAGTTFTPRHDWTKMELMRMLGWSQIPASCEVRGLFQPLIPQEARERPEVRTQTAVMVPDFRLELSASTPGLNLLPQESVSRLAELKFTCSKTHYKPGVRQHHFKRAVERRADEIVKEYQKKADEMDRLLGEGQEDEEG